MGHTVLGKTICVDYKTKKRRKAKPEELIIFKNTHKSIIDEETWKNAQRLRKAVRRSPKYGTTSHSFTGLLYCADCGGKLSYREPADEKQKEKLGENKEKLKTATARNEELNILITKLYEDYALKKITEKHFERLFKKYDEEQRDIESQIKEYQEEIDTYHKNKTDSTKFLKMIKKYTDFETLTTPMLNEYIEKVVVHEVTGGRRGKDRKQQVDVYFNFIGNIEMGSSVKGK